MLEVASPVVRAQRYCADRLPGRYATADPTVVNTLALHPARLARSRATVADGCEGPDSAETFVCVCTRCVPVAQLGCDRIGLQAGRDVSPGVEDAPDVDVVRLLDVDDLVGEPADRPRPQPG
jgi:hypothetical protein